MKFYPTHQKDLNHKILGCGLGKADILFSKKKGRIVITNNQTKKHFSFFERKEGKLDIQKMKIVDHIHYEVKVNNSAVEIFPTWAEVLIRFEAWLLDT